MQYTFFKNAPAIVYNRSIIDSLPGETIRLEATFEGESKNMKWPGQGTLLLKHGCNAGLEQISHPQEWQCWHF